MTTGLSSIVVSRLEKAAVDGGFDRELPRDGDWLAFASTQSPLRVWLGAVGSTVFFAAFSQQNVARALDDCGTTLVSPLPEGALGGRAVTDIPTLHRLVRRAFRLSKTLPDALLHAFEKQTAALPRTTEAERWVVERVGQDLFREGLVDYWEGRCAVTGLAVPDLLRASHIKPWADCEADAERLDVFNGLLLAAHLDAAFDRGLVTFTDEGKLVCSGAFPEEGRALLGITERMGLVRLEARHRKYLPWHRERVFRG